MFGPLVQRVLLQLDNAVAHQGFHGMGDSRHLDRQQPCQLLQGRPVMPVGARKAADLGEQKLLTNLGTSSLGSLTKGRRTASIVSLPQIERLVVETCPPLRKGLTHGEDAIVILQPPQCARAPI